MRPFSSDRFREFLRFLIVGGVSALCSWFLLFSLVEWAGLHYLAAFVLTFLIVNTAAFVSNGRFAFRGRGAKDRAALLRFYAISGTSLLINALAMKWLVDLAGWWYLFAAVFLAAVNAPMNYLMHRRLTYRV